MLEKKKKRDLPGFSINKKEESNQTGHVLEIFLFSSFIIHSLCYY